MTDEIQKRLDVALASAWNAGATILRYYREQSLEAIWKGDGSPVTLADEEAETMLRADIGNAFPDDAMIGEEHEDAEGTSGYKWILDPLDGTESFVRKVPIFGVLIGLELNGAVVGGIVYMPAQRELAWAGKGLGTLWVEDTSGFITVEEAKRAAVTAKVSSINEMSDALMTTTGQGAFHRSDRVDRFKGIRDATRKDRGWGNCWGHLLVATGRVDLSVEPKIREWDIAPFKAIVEEAGGRMTDLNGDDTIYSGHVLCTNGLLHDRCVEALKV